DSRDHPDVPPGTLRTGRPRSTPSRQRTGQNIPSPRLTRTPRPPAVGTAPPRRRSGPRGRPSPRGSHPRQ
ncbi:DUF2892 domain-containing protein, partial [Dysosmobacter welbionis]